MAKLFGVSLKLALFTFLPDNYYIKVNTENQVTCSHKCMNNRACQAMVYNLITHTCFLFNEKIITNPSGINNADYVIYNAFREEECYSPVTVCPTDRGFIQAAPTVDVCYKIHTDRLPNPEANEVCKQEGARGLLQIDTRDKFEKFQNLIPQYQYSHVSGYREPDNTWLFHADEYPTAVPFLQWAPSQPNGATRGQDCLAVDADGIHDASCDGQATFPYICGM